MDYPRDLDPELRDLIHRCLNRDHELRPTIKQVLQHAFFAPKIDKKPTLSSSIGSGIGIGSRLGLSVFGSQKIKRTSSQSNQRSLGAISTIPTSTTALSRGQFGRPAFAAGSVA